MKNIKTTQHGSVNPFLDARTPMANSNLLPVKLSVYLNGSQFRIGLQLYATKEIFDKAISGTGNIPIEAKIIKEQVDKYLQKATDILYNFPKTDQKQFTNLFKSEANLKVQNKTNLEVLFQMKIDELKEEDGAVH